jgi:hypothetical protein
MKAFLIHFTLAIQCCYAYVARRSQPAPFHEIKGEKILVEDEYLVVLESRYSLDAHFKFLGMNLSQTAAEFKSLPFINAYTIQIESSIVHSLIRYDPSVVFVRQDCHTNSTTTRHEESSSPSPQSSRLREDYGFNDLSKRSDSWEIGHDPIMEYGRNIVNTWEKVDEIVNDYMPGVY